MNGFFITFEGIDGCGKSTHIDLFHRKLQDDGQDVLLLREPGGTIISERIRGILLDKGNTGMCIETELLLFEAARAQIVREVIVPALEAGKIVLCDRFIDSSVAYQGYGRQIGRRVVDELNNYAIGKTLPDLTFLFDLDPETAESRLSSRTQDKDRLDEEGPDFVARTRAGYLEIARDEPQRIKVLDARKEIDDLSREIYKIFKEVKAQ
ncbi:MAG: dTMP kinase [Saccharofermentanales bacterium]